MSTFLSSLGTSGGGGSSPIIEHVDAASLTGPLVQTYLVPSTGVYEFSQGANILTASVGNTLALTSTVTFVSGGVTYTFGPATAAPLTAGQIPFFPGPTVFKLDAGSNITVTYTVSGAGTFTGTAYLTVYKLS